MVRKIISAKMQEQVEAKQHALKECLNANEMYEMLL